MRINNDKDYLVYSQVDGEEEIVRVVRGDKLKRLKEKFINLGIDFAIYSIGKRLE